MRRVVLGLAMLFLLSGGITEQAQAVPTMGPNGHFYEFIAGTITWAPARTAALALTHMGQPGYLATITSIAENTFLVGLNSVGWIGGTDQVTEGMWVWADGPEANVNFWNGGPGGSSPTFASWGAGEPNDFGNNEDGAELSGGTWNDDDNDIGSAPNGYFVEFNAPSIAAIPEPSTYLLFGTGLLGILGYGWRRRK